MIEWGDGIAEWRARAGNLLRGLGYLGVSIALGAGLVAALRGDWHECTHVLGAACLMLLALGFLRLRARVLVLESVGVRVNVRARLELDPEHEPKSTYEQPN